MRSGKAVAGHAIAGIVGIHHLNLEDAVYLDPNVVFREAILGENADGLLFQLLYERDLLEERHQEMEPVKEWPTALR